MKKHIRLLLYCIALLGIGSNIFFDSKILGIAGYASLLVVSVIQITEMIKRK